MGITALGSSVTMSNPHADLERLFHAEYRRVVAIAHRVLADAAAAEDVAQEVFLDFHRRHRADATWAPAWLHRAAAHSALNALRARQRRSRRELVEERSLLAPVNPAQAALDAERLATVREVLARLPERAATILVLRHSGLSYAEVANATGIAASSIGTLLRRAETAFRKEVGDAL